MKIKQSMEETYCFLGPMDTTFTDHNLARNVKERKYPHPGTHDGPNQHP
jgi:hypothetical protein